VLALLTASVLSSCMVEEKASLLSPVSLSGGGRKEKAAGFRILPAPLSRVEKMKEGGEPKREEEAAGKTKLAGVEAEAKAKAQEEALAAKAREREASKLARLEAKKKAEAERAMRQSSREVVSSASPGRRAVGFFSLLSPRSAHSPYQSEGHDIYVNEFLLPTLNPANAKIEVSLGEQRARVYRRDGGEKWLVIDTQISSGKPGHATSTGTYQIKEKLVAKQSSLYGTWVNSAGETVGSSSDSRSRPAGASQFVGAEMPYWMRINGGIGMHIGHVPGYPASHGCIRVPEAIQPLIYSKVGLGTQVTIFH